MERERDGKLERHPLSAAFGTMGEADRAELKASLEAEHDNVQIIVHDGKVIDGWHRYRCMLALGLDPTDCIVELPEGIDPTDFALRANEFRRHISKLDRAKARIRCYRWREANGGPKVPSLRDIAQEMGVSYVLVKDAGDDLDGVDVRARQKARNDAAREKSGKVLNNLTPGKEVREEGDKTPSYEEMQLRMKAEKATRDKERAEREAKDLRARVRDLEETNGGPPFQTHATGKTTWYTPPEVIKAARSCMGGIDIDPCSSAEANKIVLADAFYTEGQDGLNEVNDWSGRVWMNPPYDKRIGAFVERLVRELSAGNVKQAITITNNATETSWGQVLLREANAICFPAGRISFVDAKGEKSGFPLQGQMICGLAVDKRKFRDKFGKIGVILC